MYFFTEKAAFAALRARIAMVMGISSFISVFKCITFSTFLFNQNLLYVAYAVRYNSGHSFEIRTRFPTSPFVKYWTLLVSLGV